MQELLKLIREPLRSSWWRSRLVLFLSLAMLGPLAACQDLPTLGPTLTAPPPTSLPIATSAPIPDAQSGAGYDAFLSELEGSLLRDRPVLVSRYLAQLSETPLIDGNRVIFFWRGAANSVQLAGDMNNWDPAVGPALRHIEGTDLWLTEGEYERDARLDYRFLIDGTRRELDPLNPRIIRGGLGPNSELVMPDYFPPPEVDPLATPAPAGTLTEHTLESTILGQTRTFFVYTPASELIGEKPPSVYIHDGGEYISLIDAPAILDQLIASGDIPPLIAIFVPPVIRNSEYDRNDNYVQFLADELAPFVQQNYGTTLEAGKTANLGASLGGLLAVYAAVTRPDTFGLAGGYSGAFSLGDDEVITLLQQKETLPVRFFLVVGAYETAVGGSTDEGNLLEANRRLTRTLQERFYDFDYVEAPQGHSWGLWRDYLGDGLRSMFGR